MGYQTSEQRNKKNKNKKTQNGKSDHNSRYQRPFFVHLQFSEDKKVRKQVIKYHQKLLAKALLQKIHFICYPLFIMAFNFGSLKFVGMSSLFSVLVSYLFAVVLYFLSKVESRFVFSGASLSHSSYLDKQSILSELRAIFPYANQYIDSLPLALQNNAYQVHCAFRFERHMQNCTLRYISLIFPSRFKRLFLPKRCERLAKRYKAMGLANYLIAHSQYGFLETLYYSVIDFNVSAFFQYGNGRQQVDIHQIQDSVKPHQQSTEKTEKIEEAVEKEVSHV